MRDQHVNPDAYVEALGRTFVAHSGRECQGCIAKGDDLLCKILPECGNTTIFLESHRKVVWHVKEVRDEFDA
jgi:hypothetical protein